ncbi:MAG: hypothetical protein V3R26_00460 [Hyphomicrobium sp.]
MAAAKDEVGRAVDLAIAGEWAAAHKATQQLEGNATADWLHAVLHKIEGDHDNARYWYRRISHEFEEFDDPKTELAAIRASLSP